MNSRLLRSRRRLPLAIALALGIPAAHAATITVTTGGDAGTAGTCTLRQALDSANNDAAGTSNCVAGSGDDTIGFAANLQNSTITLAGQPLVISSNLTLTGSGQKIDADGLSPVMTIDPSATTYVSNLTLTGGDSGFAPQAGGLNIIGQGPPSTSGTTFGPHLVQHKSPITHLPQAGQGVMLSRVTITGNTSKYAGGLVVGGGYASLYQCTVSNNSATSSVQNIAGGLVAFYSAVVIEDSTISGNTVPAGGSNPTGAAASYNSFLILANTTVSGNAATGTDYVTGGVAQSSNGGTYLFGAINSTISGNSATGTGTNLAGGLMVGAYGNGGGAELGNTIIDGNTASGGSTPNIETVGTGVVDAKYSLLGTELQATLAGNGNVFAANPKLGPLANNGGPTLTRALLAGSPAIDAGSNDDTQGFETDQRGPGFDRIVGPSVDIGAFEVQAAAAAGSLPVPTLTTWGAALFGGLLALFGLTARRKKKR